MAAKYNLTDTQIRHLAIICYREQGVNDAGVRACASHMCNYYEKYQRKNYKDVYECTYGSGWYWSKEKNTKYLEEHPNVPDSVVKAVRDVICNGKRTLPEHIDQYDRLKDIRLIINNNRTYTMERDEEYVMNRKNYVKDKTLIENIYADPGERYTFYCFPDGVDGHCDAFGYISKSVGTVSTVAAAAANIPDKACTWAEGIASDQKHGYSQANRWGPDYDCSSLVISAYIKAGVAIDKNKVYYTGNMSLLKNYGFAEVTASVNLNTGAGMKRGDILYYHISGTNGHTAMFCGNGRIVHARGQSYGSSKTGDQGTEIAVTTYSRSKWQHVLRYQGGGSAGTAAGSGSSAGSTTSSTSQTTSPTTGSTTATMPELRNGSVGAAVSILQGLLDIMGYRGMGSDLLDIDGELGSNTEYAMLQYQRAVGLTPDGICGKNTWKKLKEGMKT